MKKRNFEEIELIKSWLTFARENLLTAKSVIKEDFSPFHTICFMCQMTPTTRCSSQVIIHFPGDSKEVVYRGVYD